MKTDFSKLPREEIEARITTMLMGEMPADEACELMDFTSRDAELLRLHDGLKATISLVAEASSTADEPTLSDARREAVLQAFKTVQPAELREPARPERNWAQWAAMAAMVGLLLGGTMIVFQSSSPPRRSIAKLEEQQVANAMQHSALQRAKQHFEGRGRGERSPEPQASHQTDNVPGDPAFIGVLEPAKQSVDRELRPQSKIELPSVEEAQTAKQDSWNFAVGQSGTPKLGDSPKVGSLFEAGKPLRGDAINNAVTESQLAARPAEDAPPRDKLPEGKTGATRGIAVQSDTLPAGQHSAGITVGGRYDDRDAAVIVRPIAPAARPATISEGKDRVGADSKKQLEARGEQVPNGARVVAPPSSDLASGNRLPAQDSNAPAEVNESLGMGGGAMMSMQYYMSNPELMKRYFPQMYQMMTRGQTNGGSFGGVGGVAGFPGMPGLATTDGSNVVMEPQSAPMAMTIPRGYAGGGMDRYRMMPMQSPVAASPMQNKPEQEVVLQTKQQDDLAGGAVRATPHIIQERRGAEELAKLKENRNLVEQRIQQERADVAKAQVEVGDRAEGGTETKKSLLGRLLNRGEERVVRIEVAKDATDITPLRPSQGGASYDPYFVQNEIEKIRSQKTLGEVVDTLRLDQKWGEAEGRKLSRDEAIARLKKSVTVEQERNTGLTAIHARGDNASDAAQIANTVADVYRKQKLAPKKAASEAGIAGLSKQLAEQDKQIAQKEAELAQLREAEPPVAKKPIANAAIPQPEVLTAENAFSTFSLNVSDVSFKLAAAGLEKGLMPDAATVRSEEFINAFDYRDPEPQGAPVGFVWERARYPFAQDRDLVRFSVKTAASGRQAGRPLNLVLLLDSSGSMERADRVRILQECLKTLAAQLRPEDMVSVVAFARTARLWVDGLPGSRASELPARVGNLTPEGGTNLEEAMKVAYETARKHFNAGGVNRVVLLTDGAANLGDVEPESLKKKVEVERGKGIALDCFGIGWEGLNDDLLETMSRNGDGRYGFVNTPEAAASEFAGQLAGALHVAASDVKVQVEWNPKRVIAYRQIGYAKHQLTMEQFRDNSVDAAELGAAEAGNALYAVQVNAAGEGPLGTVRVRFKVPGTNDYREHAWTVDYDGAAKGLENSDYALRLAGTASAFSEWLVTSPYASEVTTDRLLSILSGVPEHFAPDPRPKKLEWMIRQAKSLTGR